LPPESWPGGTSGQEEKSVNVALAKIPLSLLTYHGGWMGVKGSEEGFVLVFFYFFFFFFLSQKMIWSCPFSKWKEAKATPEAG
jgi:hypothetical protein